MSQHWDPFQQNKPCFYIFLLVQFIANSALLLFLFPLPSFPPFPLLPPCRVVLFVWKKPSFCPCQEWHQLILIRWCPAESSSDKHLLSVRAPRLLAAFCFHCRLFSDTLLLLIHWNPPPCLRPGARARQWTGHSSPLTRVFPPPFSLWNKNLFVSLWTIKSWHWGEAKKIGTKRVQKAIQECRPTDFWPLFTFLYRFSYILP